MRFRTETAPKAPTANIPDDELPDTSDCAPQNPSAPVPPEPELETDGAGAINGGGYTRFPNTLPERLQQELADAARLGVTPVEVRTPKFDEIINSGEKVKWAVTVEGKVLVVPYTVQGIEISHAVLTNGEPVIAAGEAYIAGYMRTGYYLLEIDNRSGHFLPSAGSVNIGVEAFRAAGVNVSGVQINTVNP